MRAIIMAGGKGTRLRPLTHILPKPLIPIGEESVLSIIIKSLKGAGFNHITLTVNYKSDLIKAIFGDGSKFGLKIDYVEEEKALGTIAPLTLIPDLPDNFLVMNGDTFTDINYSSLMDFHIKNKNIFTITTKTINHPTEYGVVTTQNNNIITFKEKPTIDLEVCMGISVYNKKVLDHIPYNEFFGFDSLVKTFLDKQIQITSYPHNGQWIDVGRENDLIAANSFVDFLRNKHEL